MYTRKRHKIFFYKFDSFRKYLFSFLWNVFQTVSTASELRKPIYWIVAGKAIDYEQMLLLMANVKWDVKEIMSQHNIYVDALLKASTRNTFVREESTRRTIPIIALGLKQWDYSYDHISSIMILKPLNQNRLAFSNFVFF